MTLNKKEDFYLRSYSGTCEVQFRLTLGTTAIPQLMINNQTVSQMDTEDDGKAQYSYNHM